MSSSVGAAVVALGLTLALFASAAGAERAGTVEGVVTLGGPVPTAAPIPVEPRHHEACGAEVPFEALLVDPGSRGVRNAVAYLHQVPARDEPAAPPARRVLENRNCLFVPHVVTARVGDTLTIRNADAALHNIRARELGERRSVINVVQPTRGQETDRDVRKAAVLSVTCDTHPHMQAYLLAFEHPHFAVTDAAGRFRLAGVPPGRYRLVVWHEGWRMLRVERGRPIYDAPRMVEADVAVPAGGTAQVRVELPAESAPVR